MRAVKAKALRRALGFHPGAARDYDITGVTRFFTGHVRCKGVRGEYQKVKRAPVITEAVLRAAMKAAA